MALSSAALDVLEGRFPVAYYPKNAIIFHQSEAGGRLWHILSGVVKISVLACDGRERVFDLLGAGDWFGEHSIFADVVAGVTATVVEDARLVGIPAPVFLGRLKSDDGLAMAVLESLHRKIHRRGRQLVDAAFGGACERVASALLYLDARQPCERRGTLRVSQQAIADLIGVSRVTVAYALTQLEDEGLIDRNRRTVRLAAPERLRRLAVNATVPAAEVPSGRATVR